MYCKNCGHRVDEESRYCPVCGKSLTGANNEYSVDKPSGILNFVSFAFPPAGLLLYIMYEDRKPNRAKAIKRSACAGWVWCILIGGIGAFWILKKSAVYMNDSAPGSLDGSFLSYFVKNEPTEEDMMKEIDVSFGDMVVKDDGVYRQGHIPVTVINRSDTEYDYTLTVSAYDVNGGHLATNLIFTGFLDPGETYTGEVFQSSLNDVDSYYGATYKVEKLSRMKDGILNFSAMEP